MRPIDIATFLDSSGAVWVRAGTGGMSTYETVGEASKKWWKLAAGSTYDNTLLLVWNDGPDHWLWEPKRDMLMTAYKAALAVVNLKFTRV